MQMRLKEYQHIGTMKECREAVERLTKREISDAIASHMKDCRKCDYKVCKMNGNHIQCLQEKDIKAYEELEEYKELEEQGLLLRLQFRVGDFVWDDEFKTRCKITGYSFGKAEDYIDDPVSETEVVYYYTNLGGSITGSFAECEIGKTMFHSKEEAEAALAKTKG